VRDLKIALSPYFGNRCRFHPSCSEYGIEALKRHGLLRGGMLTVYRLLRCQPFAKGGIDEVPETGLAKRAETHSLQSFAE
ncbi:UNVERIFIED_CONTAM: hypothetical protein GTU68_025698, partial [Idotea baltica]|nr:hypothetical protein [Idotea baltica]